ncbi:MAG: RDD family protein, partial [Bacteroidetes bacterium]
DPEAIMVFAAGMSGFVMIELIVYLLYFAGMESSKYQATLGKMAIGVIVIDENGNRISFGRGAGRLLSKILSAMILYIGFIMAGFDSRKQALHDKIASTFVVYKD